MVRHHSFGNGESEAAVEDVAGGEGIGGFNGHGWAMRNLVVAGSEKTIWVASGASSSTMPSEATSPSRMAGLPNAFAVRRTCSAGQRTSTSTASKAAMSPVVNCFTVWCSFGS